MNLKVNKEEFENALSKVSCALGDKNEDLITKNFGIKAEGKTLTVCASSQKISAEYVIETGENLSIENSGAAVIDGASILSNVSNLHPNVMLSIKTEETEPEDEEDPSAGTLEINYETSSGEKWSHEHSLLSEEYFPAANLSWSSKHKVTYSTDKFIDHINRTAFAASDDKYRAEYNALLISFEEDGVIFFATDGRQMAYIKDVEVKSKSNKHALLKAADISKIAKKKVLDTTEDIEISIEDSEKKGVTPRVKISQNNFSVVSNFFDADRLPFEKIITMGGKQCSFIINAGTLRDGLRALSDLENKETVWEFGKKKIVIRNSANYNRKSSGNVSGVKDFDGEECKMTFSARYWTNILSKCDPQTDLEILVRSTAAPIDLSVSKEPNICNFFIMPINDVDE